MRRLTQLPGVSATTAATLMAAIGDISRFPTPRHLVGYLGLNPKVRQSGSEPTKYGRISKHGPGAVRAVLTEAAWVAARTPGPLRAFWERTARRRGPNIATIAVARKLVVIAWNMLRTEQDYAFNRPAAVREKRGVVGREHEDRAPENGLPQRATVLILERDVREAEFEPRPRAGPPSRNTRSSASRAAPGRANETDTSPSPTRSDRGDSSSRSRAASSAKRSASPAPSSTTRLPTWTASRTRLGRARGKGASSCPRRSAPRAQSVARTRAPP